MESFRKLTESLARSTSRRGLFGRGAGLATGALIGVAAGTLTRPGPVSAGFACQLPSAWRCPCAGCTTSGVCAKPCIIMTVYYSSGCWVEGSVTCCDCDCNGLAGPPPPNGGPGTSPVHICGCSTDWHAPGGPNCPKDS